MRSAVLLLAVAATLAVVPVSAQPPLTREEARRLPPERLARRVLGDLARILLPMPIPARDRWRGDDVLRELSFLTPPRFGGEGGLCETDHLRVRFEPVGPLEGVATPVRARFMELTPQYFIRDLARIDAGGPVEEEEQRREDRACAAVDPRTVTRIDAAGGNTAARGLRRASAFVRAARAGRALAPIACRLDDADREASLQPDCLAEVAGFRLERVRQISECNDPDVPDAWCLDVSDWSTQLRVWVRPGSQEPVRAAVERVIIIT